MYTVFSKDPLCKYLTCLYIEENEILSIPAIIKDYVCFHQTIPLKKLELGGT